MQRALTREEEIDLATIAYELGHNPKTRAGLAKLINEVNPDRARASFPDIVQEQRFEQLKRDVANQLDMSGARAAKQKVDEQRAALAKRYSEEEIGKIEQVMDRFGTHDYEAGAVLYAHENPPPDPSLAPPSPTERPGATWEFPTVAGRDGKDLSFKDFAADPRGHSLNAAYNVIHEFKSSRLSPAFRR